MNIEIEKEEMFDTLHRLSANLGIKLQASEVIASTKEDEQRIMPLWCGAVSELSQLLSSHCSIEDAGDRVIFVLDVPKNWKSASLGNLALQCKAFLANSLFARWLDAVKPDSAALCRSLNKNYVVAIEHILSLREKPKRDI